MSRPEESEHPQIEEYTEFLRDTRTEVGNRIYYFGYVPVTAR